jgi:hypothetical protein
MRPRQHALATSCYCTVARNPQVSDWFTNWRARHWRPTVLALAAAADEAAGEAAQGRGVHPVIVILYKPLRVGPYGPEGSKSVHPVHVHIA